MSGPPIEALDLAALLCSRVCHDLISPVGAIVNGLEVLEDETDEETKDFAIELIKKSAGTASAKLQFCRIAFGAAGSAGAQIDHRRCRENLARLLRGRQDQAHLESAARAAAQEPGQAAAQSAADRRAGAFRAAARSTVDPVGTGETMGFKITAAGANAKVPPAVAGAAGRRDGRRRARRPPHPAVLYRAVGARLRHDRQASRSKATPSVVDRPIGAPPRDCAVNKRLSRVGTRLPSATKIKRFPDTLTRLPSGERRTGRRPSMKALFHGRPAARIPDRDQRKSRHGRRRARAFRAGAEQRQDSRQHFPPRPHHQRHLRLPRPAAAGSAGARRRNADGQVPRRHAGHRRSRHADPRHHRPHQGNSGRARARAARAGRRRRRT